MVEEFYGAHIRHMQARWEAAMLAEGFESILVHAGSPIISFQDDFEYAFRPNPHFLAWLPLTHHHDSVVLLRPGEKPLLWYYQPEDYWYLPPSDPQAWWSDFFEVRIVPEPESWRQDLPAGWSTSACAALGDAPVLNAVVDRDAINPESLTTRLHLDRTRKTRYEIECMAAANLRAARAHKAAESAFRQGKSEFEIHHAYLGACQQSDAELPYHSIVALNQHGAVLHYQGREKQTPKAQLSFLIDAGSTQYAYAADVTRTYTTTEGEFANLISAMDQAQQQLAGQVRAGLDYRQLHLQTHQSIAGILADAGVINCSADDAVATGLSSVFYPHGLGHFIGLQTHDVAGLIDNQGADRDRPEGHPFLRLTRDLEAGNVVTIEPGLYFIEPLLQRWKDSNDAGVINWRAIERLSPYGGIRIEDNVAVTEQSNRNLTREAFMALGV